ncbi:nucleoside phosphorylase [Mogibacterium sp.]
MKQDFYDSSFESIISPQVFYGEKGELADICIPVLSYEIHDYLLSTYACEKCGEMIACNVNTNIYVFKYKNIRIAFYQSAMGAAISAHQLIESNWITGAENFVMFGSAGSLNENMTKGKYIVPTKAYRGEGLSFYYAPADNYIDISCANNVIESFELAGIPYVSGKIWTTDSMYRETKKLVSKRKQEGCIAVDMEVAGVQAVCDFYNWNLYDFLVSGDIVDTCGYDVGKLKEANHGKSKLKAVFAIINYIAANLNL